MTDDEVRNALARLLFQIDLGDDQPPEQVPDVCYEDADAILASDVLATIKADAWDEALRPFEELFAGGPDTPCRTTWPEGIECVEVPIADLRVAFKRAKGFACTGGTCQFEDERCANAGECVLTAEGSA